MATAHSRVRGLLLGIAASVLLMGGCAGPRVARVTRCAPPPCRAAVADAHFHIANYAMQGVPLKRFVDVYMGDFVARSVVFPLPLQQKWDLFEHYADDLMPPNYYMGPRAGMYYYSAVDAMVATQFLELSAADQARLDPMIVGFNPMDQYGVNHVKRMLLMYPGVFSGIGEFSVHKELVGDKISDDRVADSLGPDTPRPSDVTNVSRNTLYNPALETLFDFAGEAGLIINLHCDVYPSEVTYEGKVIRLSPESPYTEGLKHLHSQSPAANVIWAHTGLGRFVKPAPNHLEVVSEVLDACPTWCVDLSWDLVQKYMVNPQPGMPSLDEWAAFITKYRQRVLWGSDSVIFSRNKIKDDGELVIGKEMGIGEYRAALGVLEELWAKVGSAVARDVKYANYVRLYDAARVRVRAWEAAHANDNIWNLPVRMPVPNG